MDTLDQENPELFATLSKTDPWRLQRQYFPSKLGGFPAWLDPVNLPSESELKCDQCSSIMTFVLQIYSPDDLCEENDSFHRTIFLFVCQPCGNQWKAFRSQLARRNKYYDFHPVDDNIIFPDVEMTKKCCLICGLPSDKKSKGEIPELTNMKIQILDTEELREFHDRCKIVAKHNTLSSTLEEWILNICEGEIKFSETYLSHEMSLYRKYLKEKKESGEQMDETEEEAFESIQEENLTEDKSFIKFIKKTTPNEVLYYSREGEPLWISDKTPRPVISGNENRSAEVKDNMINGVNNCVKNGDLNQTIIPKCENCGSKRTFEFQVLPQLLHYLKSDRIDFGSICVYTCSRSCKIEDKYKKEVVFIEKDYSLLPKQNGSK